MSTTPQYKLSVGRRFTYRSAGIAIPSAATALSSTGLVTDWECFAIGKDRHGFSRVAFSYEAGASGHSSLQAAISSEGYFDISADGQIIENDTITPLANPTTVFPRLPRNAAELESGWSASLYADSTRREFSSPAEQRPSPTEIFRFVENNSIAIDAVYLASRDREYEFDCELGVVQSVETLFRRGWPAGQAPSSEIVRLSEVGELDRSDVSTMAESTAEYFDACAEYQQFIDLTLWDLSRSAHWLQKAFDALELVRPRIAHSIVRRWLERKLDMLARERDGLLVGNQLLAEAVGKPAKPWQAVDLDGVMCESSDFLGRTLVLCFWDRGCAWSLRTLLALNELAGELRNRPVAFVGLGAATPLDSARFVWQSLGMQFPTVFDDSEGSIAASYLVDGYPATVVVDRGGVLRRHRSGHSFAIAPTLAAEIAKLEEQPRMKKLRLEI